MGATSTVVQSAPVNGPIRTGLWLRVLVQVPGAQCVPAGILLWDPTGDALLSELRQLEPGEIDEDIEAFWLELPDFLCSMAADVGGLAAIEVLESSSSHFIQLSTRSEVEIRRPAELLRELFETQVISAVHHPRFGEFEVNAAQQRLPTLPSSTMRIIAAFNDPLMDTREIEKYIARDPVLSAHIIRIANLASLQLSEPARTLPAALRRIGFDTAKFHIAALSIGRMYASPGLRQSWDHAVAVAQVARQIAEKCKLSGDEAALLALVHDIGRIVIFGLGEDIPSWYAEMQQRGQTGIQIEAQLCSTNHSEIGAKLLRSWGFPDDMCDAVENHHTPSRSMSPFASVLYLAESWLEGSEDIYQIPEHSRALSTLKLGMTSLTRLKGSLDSDLQVMRSFA